MKFAKDYMNDIYQVIDINNDKLTLKPITYKGEMFVDNIDNFEEINVPNVCSHVSLFIDDWENIIW